MLVASISEWWFAMDAGGRFFYGIALVATFVLFVQTALMLFGMEGGGDLDAVDTDGGGGHVGDHHGDGLGILSVRTAVAFLVGFGWIGVMATDSGLSPLLALVPAAFAGLLVMLAVWWLMKTLLRLRSSGTLDFVNAIGEVGTVYLPIPPDRKGPGQVEVMIQGRLMVVDAYSSAPERIENHAKVLVIDVVGENALVVRPAD